MFIICDPCSLTVAAIVLVCSGNHETYEAEKNTVVPLRHSITVANHTYETQKACQKRGGKLRTDQTRSSADALDNLWQAF